MPFYESTEQLKEVFETFWPRAKSKVEVFEKLVKSEIVVRFDIEQPELHVTIDFKNPGPDGELGTLSFDSTLEPEIIVWSTSETTNKFWQGKLNTTFAMAKGQVKMKGSISKALGMLSKIKPLFKIFPEVLKDMGLDHMVV
ncbi:MAG: SCP2 sterol-binding domain-containing protein [Candidatus Thorarchaeota archaeon]|nr:SCP2 sterol-binding domain-containing protein [Candidatus Thorarchaeota archaeon]